MKIRGSFAICVSSFLLIAQAGAEPGETSIGRVVSVEGPVTLFTNGNAKKGVTVAPRQALQENDTIQTGSGGKARVLLADKTVLDVSEKSELHMAEFKRAAITADRQVTLDLKFGKVRTAVVEKLSQKGSFQMRTRSTVLGVRGTEFLTEAGSSGAASVTVARGEVAVVQAGSTGAPVLVQSGFKLSALGGSIGAPVAVSPAEMQKAFAAVRVSDGTFQKEIRVESSALGRGTAGPTAMADLKRVSIPGISSREPAGKAGPANGPGGPEAHILMPGQDGKPPLPGFLGGMLPPGGVLPKKVKVTVN